MAVTKAVLPYMKKHSGAKIINLSIRKDRFRYRHQAENICLILFSVVVKRKLFSKSAVCRSCIIDENVYLSVRTDR